MNARAVVGSTSIRTAGDEMDQQIIAYARQVHNMVIGERTAEEIKIEAGSAYPLEEEGTIEIRGRVFEYVSDAEVERGS